jgi:hypothetical protein
MADGSIARNAQGSSQSADVITEGILRPGGRELQGKTFSWKVVILDASQEPHPCRDHFNFVVFKIVIRLSSSG